MVYSRQKIPSISHTIGEVIQRYNLASDSVDWEHPRKEPQYLIDKCLSCTLLFCDDESPKCPRRLARLGIKLRKQWWRPRKRGKRSEMGRKYDKRCKKYKTRNTGK